MTVEERIGAADRRKMDGNSLFKADKLEEAMQQYEMVIDLCSFKLGYPIIPIFVLLFWQVLIVILPFLFPMLGHSVHG